MSGLTAASLGGLGQATLEQQMVYHDILLDQAKALRPSQPAAADLLEERADMVLRGQVAVPAEFLAQMERPAAPPAPVRTYGPTLEQLGPEAVAQYADQALTQDAVARADVSVATSLSPQAQAARIRSQFTSSRQSRQRTGVTPMPERQQLQMVLTTQARATQALAGKKLGTGATIALVAVVTVGVLSLGALLFGRRR